MVTMTLRYARYALSALASVGFIIVNNWRPISSRFCLSPATDHMLPRRSA